MKIHSPKGMVLRSKVYLDCKEVCLKVKVKMMLLYIIYGHFAGYPNRELYKGVREKVLYASCFLPAGILYLHWKRLDF
jgi:hypothetical protein